MHFFNDLSNHGDSIALLADDGKQLSYAEFVSSADAFANHLTISERNLVFILCSNSIASVTAYVGCLRSGHVPLLIDEKINSDLLEHLVELYHPNYLILPSQMARGEIVYEYSDYSAVLLNEAAIPMYQDLALLLTTSGSTGSPKLVRQSFENIDSNAKSIVEYLQIDRAQRPITTLPMNYTYGLSIINSHLAAGATILLTDKTLMEKEFWQFLKDHAATSFGGVPYTFEILKKLRFFRMELPSLECITQAGGKLNDELTHEFVQYCQEKNIRFYTMYGQTEATARMSYLPYQKALEKCGSMGIAIPGGTFHLQDDDGSVIVENDVPSELVYTGPNVTLGYAEMPEDLIKPDENHGVLVTGDVARRDKDGFYYIVGRKKRFVKIFGNRVNLDEVEQILKNDGYSCACTGKDDQMLVVVEDSAFVMPIQQKLPSLLGLNKNAFLVKHIPSIPKNSSGKVIYSELIKELQ